MEDQKAAKIQKTMEDINDINVITNDINELAAKLRGTSEEELCIAFDRILKTYGAEAVRDWSATDKHKHKLIHLLVNCNKQKVIEEYGVDLGINTPRISDQCMHNFLNDFRFFLLSYLCRFFELKTVTV